MTLPCILKACADLIEVQQGNLIHEHVIHHKFESDVIIGSTHIDIYAKCGHNKDAPKVSDDFPHGNVVSWNAMLA